MINSINPINNITMSSSSALSQYGQAQNVAKQAAQMVFSSLTKLTGSNESGISAQALTDLKSLIENENLTKSSAYKLVNTLIDKFTALSSDGNTITQDDFMTTIKFSIAQKFSGSTNLYQLLRPQGNNISKDLSTKYGVSNIQALDLMQIMDSLPEETINKMIANLNAKEENPSENDKQIPQASVADLLKNNSTIDVLV